MVDAATECYFGAGSFEEDHIKFTVITFGVIVTVYTVVANILALFGICILYQRELTRTPKLLLSQFVMNLIIAFVAISVSLYLFIDGFRQYWFFSVHLSIIVCLTLGSSFNLLFITIDRYLIVVRGQRYLNWKKTSTSLLF